MKTRNIRWAALLLAAAMSLNVSAQKNVLRAFEKFKASKGVTIINSTHEQGQEDDSPAQSWRCNVVEFKVWKGSGITFKMKALQAAFEKDSHNKDVTYFGQMRGLDENASEEEKAKYKKTTVRYNTKDAPVVIGENTTYNVLVLRCKSKRVNYRIVVAMEWKLDAQYGCVGTLYEIEGRNDLVKATTVSAADDEKGGDDFVTRMTFYRQSYNNKDDAENMALLLSMLDYMSTHATHATDNEKGVAKAVLGEMHHSTDIMMHRGLIDQCQKVLEGCASNEVDKPLIDRVEEFYNEWKAETYIPVKEKILKRMVAYVRARESYGISDATFETLRKRLVGWKMECAYVPHRELIDRFLESLERSHDR